MADGFHEYSFNATIRVKAQSLNGAKYKLNHLFDCDIITLDGFDLIEFDGEKATEENGNIKIGD